MADVPTFLGRRFQTPSEDHYNTIHGRNRNDSSSHRNDGGDGERPQQQQHQQPPTLSPEKPPMTLVSDVPLAAVQVVDRLRWWRTRRMRELPLPLHHYVFRDNYTNYSAFGTRPLAPAVTRLLRRARGTRAQYQRYQQHLLCQQLRQRGISATSSTVDQGERRQQQQLHPLTREEFNLLDNKRISSTVAPPTSGTAATAAAAPLVFPPCSPTRCSVSRDASPHGGPSPFDAAAAPAAAIPPLSVAATGGSSIGSTSLSSVNCPTEQEVREAERLLRLYQPRAASVPVRSRRQRRSAGYGGRAPRAESHHAVDHSHSSNNDNNNGDECTSRSIRLTCLPTSDDMTEVCCASGAANSAVVLHHEPRLVIYERDLNPRAALRTARVSSDALEGLRDAAAEKSAEVFALANLPLSGFERFFYQQQLRERRQDVAVRNVLPSAPTTADAAPCSRDAASVATDHQNCSSNPNHGGAELLTALLAGEGANTEVYPPSYGVVNREDALYFGSPMTITSTVFSPPVSTPASTTTTEPPEMQHINKDAAHVSSSTAERVYVTANHSRGKSGGAPRHKQWGSLRAVSVPCLPRIYRGGCPQLQSLNVSATATINTSAAAVAAETSFSLGVAAAPADAVDTMPATAKCGRSRAGQSSNDRRCFLSSALRSDNRQQDGAHLCHRVDDLQDVYAFNPIFDAIGKGAFSKVYAAVPILRGREGMKRFCALDAGSLAAMSKGGAAGTAEPKEGMQATGAVSAASPLSTSATPTSSPPTNSNLPADAAATTNAPVVASTSAAVATNPRRTPVRSVPIVALKVIPRKARQRGQRAPAESPTSPTQSQQQNNTDPNDSVRRELVEIEREVSILRRLHHTGCSHFYEALRSPDAFVIAMRVYPGSMDARHYLSRYGPPSEVRAALVLFQLVSTVHYLHIYFGLIHRDIKLENLLFSEVDSTVSNTRITEVLGSTVHKMDPASTEEGIFADRTPSSLENRGGAEAASPAVSKSHEVMRLLRVTLIDFGLARRTRTPGMPTNVSRVRGGGNTRNQSFSVSMNSPSNLTSGLAGSPHPADTTDLSVNNSGGNTYNLRSPTVLIGTSVRGITSNASGTAQQSQQQAPSQQPQVSMTTVGHTSGGAVTGSLGAFIATRSTGNSYTVKPAMPPPLCPPRLCRSPSVAAHSSAVATTAAAATVANPSAFRIGMPSPMPSTANMFTRFLDLDEDLDEEESMANGASTTGFAGAAVGSSDAANGACEVSLTSLHATNSFRRRCSCTGFHEEESAASSTDVSASETDSEAEHEEDDGEQGGVRNEVAGKDEADAEAGEQNSSAAPIIQVVRDPNSSVSSHFAQPLPSPHTPLRLTADGPSQTTMGAGSTGTADTPPALRHRLPLSQNFLGPRDDTEAPLLLTPCGTEKYLPPEVLSWVLERGWTRRLTTVGLARAMDMYAIGVVAYVLLSGCFPFNASSRATLLHQQLRVPRCNSSRWSGVSNEAITFVQKLLEPNPLKRMTAKEALEHPFLLEARQLAEKLSLVPHGEGEEMDHSNDDNNNCIVDRQSTNHFTCFNNNSKNSNHNSNLNSRGLHSRNNSLRAHWSATTAPRANPSLPLSPSATFADRARGGDAVNNNNNVGPTTNCHYTSGLSSPARCGTQPTFGIPVRPTFSKLSTPETSFVATAAAPGKETTQGSDDNNPTDNSNTNPNAQSENGDAVFLHNADSRPPVRETDVESAFLSPVSPVTSAAQPLVPPAPKLLSPSAVPSAPPTTASRTKESPVRLGAPAPPGPPPVLAPASLTGAKGGGDDLFESLYNNIMFDA